MLNFARLKQRRASHIILHRLGFSMLIACVMFMGMAAVMPQTAQAAELTAAAKPATLPWPHWWSGTCNNAGRLLTTGNGVVGGLEVCAPSGGGLGGTIQVYFDGEGAEEWQCGELSLRYMDVAWGVTSYNVNTSNVIADDFPFSRYPSVHEIRNGTVGSYPQPGDVIQMQSYTSGDPGHTGVVESASVDGSGNGSIVMLSENGNTSGRETLYLSNWSVGGDGPNYTTAWLHNGGGSASQRFAVVDNADGRLEAFMIGSDGALYHTWETASNGSWVGSWSSLGGNWPGGIAVARNADGKLEVFARGTTGYLYYIEQTSAGGGWQSGWTSLGGNWPSDPAIGMNSDGRLEIFIRGTTGYIYHRWQTSPDGAWSSNWNELSTQTWQGTPQAINNAAGSLQVFAKGTDGALWWVVQVPGGTGADSGWSNWHSLGGSWPAGFAVAMNNDGRLEAFAHGTTGYLYHIWELTANGSWQSGWSSLGGNWPGDPTVGVNTNTGSWLDVFMRGNTGYIYHQWQTGPGTWSGSWSTLSTQVWQGNPVAITNGGNNIQVFAVGTDGALWWVAQVPGGSGAAAGWSNWHSLGVA